ncbi:MAG: DUF4271 domain-containing protein [Chitinophagaceae bacterium]
MRETRTIVRLYTLLILLSLLSFQSFAQVQSDSTALTHAVDTIVKKKTTIDTLVHKATTGVDTAKHSADTAIIHSVPALDSSWKIVLAHFKNKSLTEFLYSEHPYFAFTSPPVILGSDIKRVERKELIFYLLIGLLMLFALLKIVFAKYFNDLFRLFFRRTLKQRQITEQLSQTPLPSLIFNGFFVVIGGLYLAFLLQYYGMENQQNFWLLTSYCCAGLAIMYFLKFISLKFTGWVLNLSAATDSYIFIVFIINKVIGIFLLPFLVVLAFAQNEIFQVAITLSGIGIGCLVVYRYILSYSAVHNQIRVKPFHFLVYLVAFEIIPLLLIYKLLFRFLF